MPTPRTKPQVTAALQLASADAQLVQPPKAKPASTPAEKAEAKPETAAPETPADIINARGFSGDNTPPKQDAAAQVIAAVAARKALEAADPQSTASTSAPYQAMAYAPPAAPPADRSNIVAASAPIRGAPVPHSRAIRTPRPRSTPLRPRAPRARAI